MQAMFATHNFDSELPDTSPIGISDKALISLRQVAQSNESASHIVRYRGIPYQVTVERSVIELMED